jgi:FAD/FMN-containing dehydrogenase
MVRFASVRPAAVVLCSSTEDVAETLAFARAASAPIAVRSGGHSVAGRSSTEGIVIDVTPMSSVSVADGVATVGAGARLGRAYDALDEHGLTIPAGCGPSVGIAGLTLGGGIGILGRSHGLTCDSLLRAEVVLADGRRVDCDADHHEELFWALRGAGGGRFGVVTAFDFTTLPAPATTVFHLTWPFTEARALVAAWPDWAPHGPDPLDATLRLTAEPPLVELVGTWIGAEADAANVLDDLVARVGAEPASATLRHSGYRDAKRYLDALGAAAESGSHLFTRSEYFRRPLPADAIAALVDHLPQGLGPGESREVTFLPWGGAYNRVPSDATAFAHRDALFLVQHLLLARPPVPAAARDWLTRSWSIVHPYGSGGVYPNFPDPDVDDRAYHGANYERVQRVKAKYDPANVFI